jgi:superfamily I DNA/RNA helicase
MTIHGAKGKEFDHVYVVGLAEDILPSFQSVKAGENSPEMEEERRNCFVAITRAREWLCLSYADRYRVGTNSLHDSCVKWALTCLTRRSDDFSTVVFVSMAAAK